MKIALVTGHFMPEVGYQEVYLARAFSRLGHQVRVFTSTAVSPSGQRVVREDYAAGLETDATYGYEVHRFAPHWRWKTKVRARGVGAAVKAYAPDVVVTVALAKLFGTEVLSAEVAERTRIISFFGDAYEYIQRGTPKQRFKAVFHDLGFALLKKPLYRRVARFADRIVLNVPETEDIFRTFLAPSDEARFDEKLLRFRLGYDPDEFFYRAEDRQAVRADLGIGPDEQVLITSTRVNPAKELERVVDMVSGLHAQGLPVRYVLCGFMGDAYDAALRKYIAQQPHPERFTCFPFLDHEAIRRLYCAADLGIWVKAAISIQEAMGTGLPIVLENRTSVSHLVRDGENGWYYEQGGLAETLHRAVRAMQAEQDPAARVGREAANAAYLSYDTLAQTVLAPA